MGGVDLFQWFEMLGYQVVVCWNMFDVGLWEFCSCESIYIYFVMMCWGVCDCLVWIVVYLNLFDCVVYWGVEVVKICEVVEVYGWNEKL